MLEYSRSLLKRFWSVASIGVLALMLASAPAALARGGGGGGGGGHGGGGFGGGGGGGGFRGGGGGFSGGGFRGGGMPSGGSFRGGMGPSGGFSRSAPSMPSSNFSPGFARPSMPSSSFNRPSTGGNFGRGPSATMPNRGPSNIGRGPTTVGQPGAFNRGAGTIGQPGRVPGAVTGQPGGIGRGPGTIGQTGRVPGGVGRGTGTNQPGITRVPNQGRGSVSGQPGMGRGPTTGRGPVSGQPGRGQGTMPGGAGRGQSGRGNLGNQAHNRANNFNHGHQGDHGHHNHNNNNNNDNFFFSFGFFPGFGWPLSYGFWGFDDCGAYCNYSPFYYYGYPYVYAPRVVVADAPSYTYTSVPDYSQGGYYLSQDSYSGLNAALNDISNAFLTSQPNLLLAHVSANSQIQIYLDGNYAYSLPGSDYQKMVQDAVGHIKTSSFTFTNVEQRSDGAYTATGTQVFTDVKGVQKTVQVSFTLAQSSGSWVIVAAGSSAS